MKLCITILSLFLIISCENNDDKPRENYFLDQNIVILANQGSGFITILDLETETIIDTVDLRISLKAWQDAGNVIDDTFVENPKPHFIQPAHNGLAIYVVLTSPIGAVVKLNAKYEVEKFLQITDTSFPAHMQLTIDNSTIYLSAWTTNGGGSSPDNQNMIIQMSSGFTNRVNYNTPAGAHGIKLTNDEQRVIVGHDLSDFINDIDVDSLQNEFPLQTAKPLTVTADQNGGNLTAVHSPTQLGIAPDDSYAFFACRKSSQVLVYDLVQKDTLGFIDLESVFGVTGAGPYSIEVGPKDNYSTSSDKYAYINFKDGGGIARLKIDPNASTFATMFSGSNSDYIALNNGDARPHGLDISDDGAKAVVSSEFSRTNSQQAHVFFIDLASWAVTTTIETKIESRGLAIYPSSGN